jgi:hypothetical protein
VRLDGSEAVFRVDDEAISIIPPVNALKMTVVPFAMVWEMGWRMKLRGLGVVLALTVSVAPLLVTIPASFVIVTEYEPALDAWTFASTSRGPVSPEMAVPLKFHW